MSLLPDYEEISDVHHTSYSQAVTVEKDTPLEVDPGLLLVTDLNPIEEETYKFVKLFNSRDSA